MIRLLAVSTCSLFIGVLDLNFSSIIANDFEQIEILLISRLPRLLAILCTGVDSRFIHAIKIASIIGKEDEIKDKISGFDARITALKTAADGKSAVIGMATSGCYNVLGNDGRCSIICNEIGFDNVQRVVSLH